MDGHDNDTGFSITYSDQITRNVFLANAAHQRGPSVAPKNDLGQIVDLELTLTGHWTSRAPSTTNAARLLLSLCSQPPSRGRLVRQIAAQNEILSPEPPSKH